MYPTFLFLSLFLNTSASQSNSLAVLTAAIVSNQQNRAALATPPLLYRVNDRAKVEAVISCIIAVIVWLIGLYAMTRRN